MKKLLGMLAIGAFAAMLHAPLATAQTPPAAATQPTAKSAAPKAAKTSAPPKRRPQSRARRKASLARPRADQKKLHGKERKTFRAKCIRDARKAGGKTTAAKPAAPPAAKTK
ncbi:MAG: phosphate starvation-inducible protein PsiF [Hyphomicrobiaceae bacterium]